MRVVLSRRARQDLIEIHSWIAGDSPKAARKMIDRLVHAAEALSRFPLRYPETQYKSVRKQPVGDYLILYSVLDTVQVIRILHAARDWPAILDEA